jgi:hypothetical protein
MGGKMSRNKGARGEREFINLMREVIEKVYSGRELEAPFMRRNSFQSFGGGADVHGLEWLALEIKFQESFNLTGWWSQTVRQAGPGQLPVLAYRKSRVKWRVRMHGYLPAGRRRVKTIVDISLEAFLAYLELELKERLT